MLYPADTARLLIAFDYKICYYYTCDTICIYKAGEVDAGLLFMEFHIRGTGYALCVRPPINRKAYEKTPAKANT